MKESLYLQMKMNMDLNQLDNQKIRIGIIEKISFAPYLFIIVGSVTCGIRLESC